MPVSRRSGFDPREKDIPSALPMSTPADSVYRPVVPDERDVDALPVVTKATDYPAGHVIELHHHARGQLVYADHGVMMVAGDGGQWIVPPTRAIWMPPGVSHRIRCIGVVHMRSIYVRPDAAAHLPAEAQAVGVSGLLAELIRAAVKVPLPYARRLARRPPDAPAARRAARAAGAAAAPAAAGRRAPAPHLRAHRGAARRRLDAGRLGRDAGHRRQDDPAPVRARDGHDLRPVAPAGAPAARARAAGVGDKVVDVALALGYDSPSAFAAMFKRQFGEPPSAFFR